MYFRDFESLYANTMILSKNKTPETGEHGDGGVVGCGGRETWWKITSQEKSQGRDLILRKGATEDKEIVSRSGFR